jgi:dTDP-D-glucose 4,6-dehydratase
VRETGHRVLVVDKLTYAGNLDSLAPVAADSLYVFVQADIADAPRMGEILAAFAPDVILHLMACCSAREMRAGRRTRSPATWERGSNVRCHKRIGSDSG